MLRTALALLLLAACASAPPAGTAESDAPLVWRVVSYNIRHGEGADGRLDLARTAAVLRRLDPDVVALQEVDERVERTAGVDQAARLGALLGMDHAFGSFMDYQGGRYGLAILSHCEIRRTESVRLTDGNEPRVALVVEVAGVNDSTLTVVDVHFDWVADDGFRFTQAGEVARHLDRVDGRWILLGDFNDQPGSRTLDLFHARAHEAAKPRDRRFTFPSGAPEREIDFIFAAPADAWRARSVEVVAETVASDHRPVVAELEALGPGGSAGHQRACPR
jgi:endonuclease/exonuclease/phosphatase family metal-dependent hydrolase